MSWVEVLALGVREGALPLDDPDDSEIKTVSLRRNSVSSRTVIEASSPEDLLKKLAALKPIDRLDLYFHGAAGVMAFGRRANGNPIELFSSGDDLGTLSGVEHAIALRTLLSPGAHVRLLGCRTATELRGRLLVYKLACELGKDRIVSGMISDITADSFPDGWFNRDCRLFSSLAAVDGVAPVPEYRDLETPPYKPRPDKPGGG